jgi:hypothetical protein
MNIRNLPIDSTHRLIDFEKARLYKKIISIMTEREPKPYVLIEPIL